MQLEGAMTLDGADPRFLDIAGASNAEVRSHLYVALDVGYLEAVAHALNNRPRKILGWKPRYTNVEQVIGTAWTWHQKHPNGYEK